MSIEDGVRVRFNTDFGCLEVVVESEKVIEAVSMLERLSEVIASAKRLKAAESLGALSTEGVWQPESRVTKRPPRIAIVLSKFFPARIKRDDVCRMASVPSDQLPNYIAHKDYRIYFDENDDGIRLSLEGIAWAAETIESLKQELSKSRRQPPREETR